VEDVIPLDARERPAASHKAVGFTTVLDQHWEARNALETLDGFSDLDNGGVPNRRSVAQSMLEMGHFGGPPRERASPSEIKSAEKIAMKKIDRIRSKKSR
jgi:hypothetical protein